ILRWRLHARQEAEASSAGPCGQEITNWSTKTIRRARKGKTMQAWCGRTFAYLKWILPACVALLPHVQASAAEPGRWPSEKPVTLLVGYSPGGGADTVARLVAEQLSRKYKQRF